MLQTKILIIKAHYFDVHAYDIEKPYFLENIASIVINNCSFNLYVYTILKEDGVIHNKYCIYVNLSVYVKKYSYCKDTKISI